jgi:hypothetical protein
MKRLTGVVGLAVILLMLQERGFGQRGQGAAPANPTSPTGRAGAPFDPTGYWVSLITNNWRFRMVPPAKGDYAGIPISMAGKQLADAWEPARDEATGNQCKHYGAASIMYQPTRLHITWRDGATLRVDTDAGTQTRIFQFGKAPATAGKRTWQGNSVAVWEARRANNPEPSARYLKVTTTNMLPGYLRKNGVPYSQNAIVTEYVDRVPGPDGAQWLVVKTTVEDATYLNQPYLTSAHFMLEPDGSKWSPSACEIDPPLVPTRPAVR